MIPYVVKHARLLRSKKGKTFSQGKEPETSKPGETTGELSSPKVRAEIKIQRSDLKEVHAVTQSLSASQSTLQKLY